MPQFSLFVLRLIGIDVGRASVLQLRQDIDKSPEVLLRLLGDRPFARLGDIDEGTGDEADLVRLPTVSYARSTRPL